MLLTVINSGKFNWVSPVDRKCSLSLCGESDPSDGKTRPITAHSEVKLQKIYQSIERGNVWILTLQGCLCRSGGQGNIRQCPYRLSLSVK